ncbi:hypothetical protein K445DRAFT_153869 [Daldinia sp. EC12]|nr:hypothetical protein F4774DRAFT_35986 [Daldinia eschscholtzii]OTB19966.1 hypothetical protein K445DRAFT_153869 [Daldinia sp. EC12]
MYLSQPGQERAGQGRTRQVGVAGTIHPRSRSIAASKATTITTQKAQKAAWGCLSLFLFSLFLADDSVSRIPKLRLLPLRSHPQSCSSVRISTVSRRTVVAYFLFLFPCYPSLIPVQSFVFFAEGPQPSQIHLGFQASAIVS